MKKKILYITSLVLILLAAASIWSYYCPEHVPVVTSIFRYQ